MRSRAPHRRGALLSTPPILDRANNFKVPDVDTSAMGASVPAHATAVVVANMVNGFARLETASNGLLHDKTMEHLSASLVNVRCSHVSLNCRLPSRSQQTIPTGHRSFKGECDRLVPSTERSSTPGLRTSRLVLTTTLAMETPGVLLAATDRTGLTPGGVGRLFARHDEEPNTEGCVMTYC